MGAVCCGTPKDKDDQVRGPPSSIKIAHKEEPSNVQVQPPPQKPQGTRIIDLKKLFSY